MPVEANLIIQGGKQWIIKASESTSDTLMVFKGLYTRNHVTLVTIHPLILYM